MAIELNCPECGQGYTVDDDSVGQEVSCEECGTAFVVALADESGAITAERTGDDRDGTESVAPAIEIGTAGRTISAFMSDHAIEGGVALEDDHGASASGLPTVEEARKYDVGEMVAKGGMGAILEAKDLSCRRTVAMKVMLTPEKASQAQVLRFIEEAQITAQLEHPGIVPVHELGADDSDRAYYTMKMVQGLNLDDVLKGIADGDKGIIAKYPLNHLLNVLMKASDAVAFAHSKGVVHRDLKPENIMLGEYGEVLVMDWGLAKVFAKSTGGQTSPAAGAGNEPTADAAGIESLRDDESGDSLRTMDGQVMGTPMFMAPEQALGKVSEIDGRTDIYALGAILYNILTLRPPVEGKTVNQLLLNVSKGRITSPAALSPSTVAEERKRSAASQAKSAKGLQQRALEASRKVRRGKVEERAPFPHCPGGRIPAALSAVAMKALAKEQADRYQNVKELQNDIEAYLGGFATEAEEAGVGTLLKLFLRRHKAVVSLSAAALAIIVGVVCFAFAEVTAERNEAVEARKESDANLARFLAEKEDRQRISEGSSPEFVAKTRKLMALKQWDAALASANTAVELDASNDDGWYLRGLLELGNLQFAEAEAAFKQAEQLTEAGTEKHRKADIHARLARRCGDDLARYGEESRITVILGLAKALEKHGSIQIAVRLLEESGKGREKVALLLRAAVDRLVEVNPGLRSSQVEYGVSQSDGVHLRSRAEALVDITPLAGLPLTTLDLDRTGVRDIKALKGMPLTRLSLYFTNVHDISVLKGMPLTDLRLYYGVAGDLSALEGMPLISLRICNHRISDLSVLKGMPLSRLALVSNRIRDISVLKGMPLTELDLSHAPLSDISALKGMPLTALNLASTGTNDISVLKEMPLKHLRLGNTRVSDIRALKGVPLTGLYLHNTRVSDISVLRGMPLTRLSLTPKNITTGMDIIRNMKSLREIAGSEKEDGSHQSAAEFWRKYDAGEYSK